MPNNSAPDATASAGHFFARKASASLFKSARAFSTPAPNPLPDPASSPPKRQKKDEELLHHQPDQTQGRSQASPPPSPPSPPPVVEPFTPPINTSPPSRSPTKPSPGGRRRRHSSRHSLSASVTDIGTSLRRSASLRSSSSSSHGASQPSTIPSILRVPPSTNASSSTTSTTASSGSSLSRPLLSLSFRRKRPLNGNSSSSSAAGVDPPQSDDITALPQTDRRPSTSHSMAVPLMHPPRRQGTAPHSNAGFGHGGLGPPAPIVSSSSASGHNPHAVFQHIHEMATKRISTLDYLRKAHEGRVYWFNTLHFSKADLSRLPSFDPRKLSRRATNYLLLGFSLPTILDLNSQSPNDYLRALNSLLAEFDAYQAAHPPDGATSSSLGRARIPQMFKRATAAAGSKSRRGSAATDLGLFLGGGAQNWGNDSVSDFGSNAFGISNASTATLSFPHDSGDHSGDDYAHLLTPSLPFDPDFFETFATLCDVLIDIYTRVLSLVATPETCGPGVGELFAKADARVRKLLVAGVVREFEDASRSGVKSEVAGVGRVVLGGLM
ncbi:hypothetical protein BDY21DRAFT_383419 [Lineolata rhizophorae]|uniref:Uncharacterized protein n=1 Tax=Lineolata rhizophorae TaxID=578093 RepID=A0A6A6PBR3_9PEZI|nr:hypothetical protein BDY21DRAFT_383419 [Lineolata rhizophorae]